MNRIKTIARTIRAGIAYRAGFPLGRAVLSAMAGHLVADAICAFLVNFRHAALLASAARPPRQPVNQILVTGWIATVLVVSIVTYAVITAVVHGRQLRRDRRAPIAIDARDITPDFS